jgi:predicted enzyme related to lactoylglutathione lyase
VKKTYPAGVPCWVETLAPDARAAAGFYAGLFGWDVAGPGRMPDGGEYLVARVGGDDVAGIGTLPQRAGMPPAWTTYISVDDADIAARRIEHAGGRILVDPFDALPAGRGAVLSDPAGAVFAIWEARSRGGAQRVNASCSWAMSALSTPDTQGANEFYGSVFGWIAQSFDGGDGRVTLYRLPGYVGGKPEQPVPRDVVAVMLPKSDAPAVWNVDFWIDDADAAVERVERLGGNVVAPLRDVPPFRQAIVADIAGAHFSISQLTGGAEHAARHRVP